MLDSTRAARDERPRRPPGSFPSFRVVSGQYQVSGGSAEQARRRGCTRGHFFSYDETGSARNAGNRLPGAPDSRPCRAGLLHARGRAFVPHDRFVDRRPPRRHAARGARSRERRPAQPHRHLRLPRLRDNRTRRTPHGRERRGRCDRGGPRRRVARVGARHPARRRDVRRSATRGARDDQRA